MQQATLVYVVQHRGAMVLLGQKKRGFGSGKFNGYGGKMNEQDKDIKQTAIRELKEEAGIDAFMLTNEAVINCTYLANPQHNQQVHVFICVGWRNEPQETEEMKPSWFLASRLPFDQMWEDDIYWLPLLLLGHQFTAEVAFDQQNKLASVTLSRKGG